MDYVGIGGDYNGVPMVPVGLEDVSKYPTVFAALIEDEEYEWTDEDLGKLANQNLIRTLRSVEVRLIMSSVYKAFMSKLCPGSARHDGHQRSWS